MIDALVVDANPMLSALLGGRAREILFDRRLVLLSPQATLFEVERYLPFVAKKLGQEPSGVSIYKTAALLNVMH